MSQNQNPNPTRCDEVLYSRVNETDLIKQYRRNNLKKLGFFNLEIEFFNNFADLRTVERKQEMTFVAVAEIEDIGLALVCGSRGQAKTYSPAAACKLAAVRVGLARYCFHETFPLASESDTA